MGHLYLYLPWRGGGIPYPLPMHPRGRGIVCAKESIQSCSNCEAQHAYCPTTTANHEFSVQPCRGAAQWTYRCRQRSTAPARRTSHVGGWRVTDGSKWNKQGGGGGTPSYRTPWGLRFRSSIGRRNVMGGGACRLAVVAVGAVLRQSWLGPAARSLRGLVPRQSWLRSPRAGLKHTGGGLLDAPQPPRAGRYAESLGKPSSPHPPGVL